MPVVREVSCPYCKQPLKYSNEIARCTNCRTPHHLACWQQNMHCSVAGCEGKYKIETFAKKEKINHMKILLPLLIALGLLLLFLLFR